MNFGIEKLNIDLVANDMEENLLKLASQNEENLLTSAIKSLMKAAAKLRKYEQYTTVANRLVSIAENLQNEGIKELTLEESNYYIDLLIKKLRTIGKVSFKMNEDKTIITNINIETKKGNFNISKNEDLSYTIKNNKTNHFLSFKSDDYKDAIEFIINNRENVDNILSRFIDKKEKSRKPVAEIEIDETEYDENPKELEERLNMFFGVN